MAKVTITFEDTDDTENGVSVKVVFNSGIDADALPTQAQSAAMFALEAIAEAGKVDQDED